MLSAMIGVRGFQGTVHSILIRSCCILLLEMSASQVPERTGDRKFGKNLRSGQDK